MKFNKLKKYIDNTLCEAVLNNDKTTIKSLTNILKESELTKVQWDTYNNLEIFESNNEFILGEFIKESINTLQVYNQKEISEHNTKLAEKIGYIDTTDNSISLDDVLYEKRTVDYYTKLDNLIDSLKLENNIESKVQENFNIDYKKLDKSVQKIFLNNYKDSNTLFENIKSYTLVNINQKINESTDPIFKNKLVDVKAKLLETTYTKDNLHRLVELIN